jgi:hypothetical protein
MASIVSGLGSLVKTGASAVATAASSLASIFEGTVVKDNLQHLQVPFLKGYPKEEMSSQEKSSATYEPQLPSEQELLEARVKAYIENL